MTAILNELGRIGVIPVVTIDRAVNAIPTASALLRGGIQCIEVTFRTKAATECIGSIHTEFPEVLIGAGTILELQQAQLAAEAGASFIVTPGFNKTIVRWCREHNLLVTPGVATPTEINLALAEDIHVLKFFPAEALGGVKTLQAIAAAYRHVRFIPTGGISFENLQSYLSLPMVHACGGSWLASRSLIEQGKFEEICELAKSAREKVIMIRGE